MGNSVTIYHGSERIIERPVYGGGRSHNDYGRGFYCTESESLAKEWACSTLRDGYANRYRIDMTDMRVLQLNSEEYSILNWIAILVSNRVFRVGTPIAGRAIRYLRDNYMLNVHEYDIIVGYRADDSYFDFAETFLNNALTVEQLSEAMRLGKLGEQVVLKSRWAFDHLEFEGYSTASRELWLPVKKARDERARTDYETIISDEVDGLYMADIIRQQVSNDDDRIPRAVSK